MCRFVIPLGMCLGADVTWSQFFFNNLIPVTLGNTIAGVLMMVSLGYPPPPTRAACGIRQTRSILVM